MEVDGRVSLPIQIDFETRPVDDGMSRKACGQLAGMRIFLAETSCLVEVDQSGQAGTELVTVVDRGGEHDIGGRQIERRESHR
jgi:hypothetical protein